MRVERAYISSPQAIIPIGLDTWDEDSKGQGLPDEQAKEDIWATIKELSLDNEPLRVMNYVDAVPAGRRVRKSSRLSAADQVFVAGILSLAV